MRPTDPQRRRPGAGARELRASREPGFAIGASSTVALAALAFASRKAGALGPEVDDQQMAPPAGEGRTADPAPRPEPEAEPAPPLATGPVGPVVATAASAPLRAEAPPEPRTSAVLAEPGRDEGVGRAEPAGASETAGIAPPPLEVTMSLRLEGPGEGAPEPVRSEEPAEPPAPLPPGAVLEGDDEGGPLSGGPGHDRLSGGGGPDAIAGGAGDDEIFGGGGDDRLEGGPGDDRLEGGSGDDRLAGGDGRDLLIGGDGDDRLEGGAGSDRLAGGAGDDLLDGGPGVDELVGGAGDDLLRIDHPFDVALERPGEGRDQVIVAPEFADNLRARQPHQAPEGEALFALGDAAATSLPPEVASYLKQLGGDIEEVVLEGEAPHDILGSAAANRLLGNRGDNMLFGGSGDDLLEGLEGDDVLDGGPGQDLLYGGPGDDLYLLGLAEEGPDRIRDLEGANRLELPYRSGEVEVALVGEDLVIRHEGADVARIEGYGLRPESFPAIALKDGDFPISELLAGSGPEPEGSMEDLLAPYLDRPRLAGDAGPNLLVGGEEGERLEGGAGSDLLQGFGGDDLLDGGPGNDQLAGGAGDDLYLVRARDPGVDRIRDAEGENRIAMPDVTSPDLLSGFLEGDDLWVAVEGSPAFAIEDFLANPEVFPRIHTQGGTVETLKLTGTDG